MIKIQKPRSIAQKLALSYAVSAALILSVTVIGLAYFETSEIDNYQTAEIKNRFSLFSYDVVKAENYDAWLALKNKYKKIIQEDGRRIYIRVDSADDRYRIDAPFRINPDHLDKHHGFSKQNIDGNFFRIYSKKFPAAGERPEVILSLALDAYYYEDFDQWLDLAFDVFLLISVSTIALLGMFIAKRNLQPVDVLSSHAQSISASNLSQRLPAENLPTELQGLINSFNGVLDRLEISYRRQAAFNSDVAHELRTPVGNLIGQTEVALSKPRSYEELEEIMQSNLEELERLRSIISDMLFLSHADQGEIALNLEPCSLADEVRQTADFLEILLEENHNTLEIKGDARAPVEPSLLKRVFTNLISNAIEHGSPDSPITVEIKETDSFAEVTVINFGNDIPEADLPNLFERFYRVSKDRQNSGSNHGLGLSIVKAIIRLHRGDVFASSNNGIIKIGFRLPLSNPVSGEENQ